MNLKNIAAAALIAGTALVASAPAQAVTTPFANFSGGLNTANIYWKNGNASNTSKNSSVYTISSATATTPGAAQVTFNFLVGGLPTAINANFNLIGTVTNTAAIVAGSCPGFACFIIQSNIFGSFSFTANGNQTIGAYTIPNGTLLLGATNYSGALVAGPRGGSTASFNGSDPASGTVIYTSDSMFGLDFTNTTARDFSLSLSSIGQAGGPSSQVGLNAKAYASLTPTASMSTFRAYAGGSFGSEPSPSVPEPATWALFIAGFGMVGFQARRRRAKTSVAA